SGVNAVVALLQQRAVARERIDALRAGDRGLDLLLDALLAIRPLDREPLLGEQALFIGDELRQPLEGRRRFQHELFHGMLRDALRSPPKRSADFINPRMD